MGRGLRRALAALIAGAASLGAAPGASADVQPRLPIRAAFYYPWFPEGWNQKGIRPYTKYRPTLGFYDSSSRAVIQRHIRAMQYGRIQAAIFDWLDRGHRTDDRLATVLAATNAMHSSFRWAIYYSPEGHGDPTPAQIGSDLSYIRARYGSNPAFLRIGGRPVIFVWSRSGDGCAMASRWARGNSVNAYVVLKVFSGYRRCPDQPAGWHQYGPATPNDGQPGYSFSISPGFDKVGEPAPRLARDLTRWSASIRAMISSRARFQLITTFNEWGEGTAVESSTAWASRSGWGAYLDALHRDGRLP